MRRRRELFYWATVFSTFALGTALGDFTAHVVKLGYPGSGVLFAVAIMVPAVARSQLKLNSVLCFWAAPNADDRAAADRAGRVSARRIDRQDSAITNVIAIM